jgi:5'-nucleotidase
MTSKTLSIIVLVALWMTSPAAALNIVLTNDDGLTANVKALREALIAAGHDVVLSIPCQNQSGTGAGLAFFRPITSLTRACVGEAAAAGAPGVGPIDGIENAYYVDGTPVMAAMHGLDIIAAQRWKEGPNLLISGPNEGQNAGGIVISSGTVSNAQFALQRGVAAIAISADANTTRNTTLAKEVATLCVKLLNALQKRSTGAGVLPPGIGLNVNYPKFGEGESARLAWVITRFGDFDYVTTRFVMDLSKDSRAQALRLSDVALPGVTTVSHDAASASKDTDRQSEALVMLEGKISVTPMQFGYAVTTRAHGRLEKDLAKLLNEREPRATQ